MVEQFEVPNPEQIDDSELMTDEEIRAIAIVNEPEDDADDDPVQDIANGIIETIQSAYDDLLECRDAELSDATAPLEAEEQSLREESASLIEATSNLELLLPAQEREAQRHADAALLAGKLEEASAKRQEYETARHAPEAMKERQQEIAQRFAVIAGERQAIARRVFETWYSNLQKVIRATEKGLFIELLNKSRDEMYAYQERHSLGGTTENPYGFLVKDSYVVDLTAPDRSQEWLSGHRWYR